ncbi:MAG: DNA helicase RecQ [Treponemataceae bacterium]|nr:DNA helicase RecQ [Treponemataceae bacterium]
MDEISEKAENLLKTVFGYDSFRPLQLEIIKSVLSGNDTLAIMPTGGGKSLCYQIPALMFTGITIVVSPLISLMQDQVSALQENGVDAVFLNSALEWEAYMLTINRIRSGNVRLLYVSPEALAAGKIISLLKEYEISVSCITIDEAHCVSEWGHDFRPDYLELSSVRQQFPHAVCLALTATATSHVRNDIAHNLKMEKPAVFVSSFNRGNIFLEVKPKKDALQQVVDCIRHHNDDSGIVYCFSRKQVDKLTSSLDEMGFSVLNYHAGLSDSMRADHQEKFIRDKVKIMVATVAFGMGINKPNVRYVIHYDMPKSLEEYYQEIGRAGRDGLASHALLLYSGGDAHKIRFFFGDAADPEKSETLLQGMIHYATTKKCRRHILLGYFGEVMKERGCDEMDCCDICASDPVSNIDVTVPAQKFMSCVIRTKQRFGTAYIIDVLLGSRQKRILENGHTGLSTWGIGNELSKDNWFSLAEALIDSGYIEKYGDYNVIKLTKDGCLALQNRDKISLPVLFASQAHLSKDSESAVEKQKNVSPHFIIHKKGEFARNLSDSDLLIYNALKEWRKKEADEMNVPPYVIFGDKTLEDLVQKKPSTDWELLDVFGIGERKAEHFGSQILRVIRENQTM